MNLKPYPEYKDSGMEWIGEIPKKWAINKIKNTSYVKGRIGWHGLSSEEYADEGAYLVTGTDLKSGKVSWKTCHHISLERYKEDPYIHLRDDDLLITKDGTIGKVAIVRNLPDKATLNSGIFVVRPLNDDYIPEFMYWTLNSSVFERYFDYIKTGATIAHLYQETFERFFFPIPTEIEQVKISNFLDKKISEIDLTIEKDSRLIELLKEKRTALINHVVTKGLDPMVRMKDSGVEWIGEIPEDWEVVPLTKFLESKSDYRGKTPEKVDDGVFLVTAKNIKEGRINYDLSKEYVPEEKYDEIMRRGKPKVGDLLFTTEAPLGEVANVDYPRIALAQRIIKMRGKQGVLDNYFLKYYIMSKTFQGHLQRLATGSTALGIKASKLFILRLILPPHHQQLEIVQELGKSTSNIDNIIKKININIELLEEYKKSIIHHVVTGKINVLKED